MKKLMITAAAIAVGFMAQAASYEWSGADVYQCWDDASSELYAGGTAYLFIAGEGVASDFSDVIAAVNDGTFVSGGWAGKALDNTSLTSEGAFGNTFGHETDFVGKNALAIVIADSYYNEEGEKIAITEKYGVIAGNEDASSWTVPAQPTLGSATVNFNSFENSYDPSGWTAQSVPEPTSGLLLLLGVAGLALRRRRA